MSTPENRPIRPQLVAAKLDKARNFETPEVAADFSEEPRRVEMLWFLQFVSQTQNYPGGLSKFACDLVGQSFDFLATATMKANAGKKYTQAARLAILEELPKRLRWDANAGIWDDRGENISALMSEWESDDAIRARRSRQDRDKRRIAEEKERYLKMEEADFVKLLSEAALEGLSTYLLALCEQPCARFHWTPIGTDDYHSTRPPRAFGKCSDAILRFMDNWRIRASARIAETRITRHCFEWLEKAAKLRGRGVMIEGNSRFGKTDAVRTWCEAHPGRARFVRTPPAGGEAELLRAVASALGIERRLRSRSCDLRDEIEFVLRHSGLMLIFDEAQFIWPSNFHRNSPPARLNWIRCNLLDAGFPVAFIFTPQSYSAARAKFVKATGFAVEQFDGRILKTVLPPEVSREDLLAIASIHFPGVAENLIEYVVRLAAATERNYVSDVSNIALLAFHNAEKAARAVPKLQDIKAAIADVLPATQATQAAIRASAPSASDGNRLSEPLQDRCSLPASGQHAREMRPAGLLPSLSNLERFDAAAIDLATPP